MKINVDFKGKYPSVEFCYRHKAVMFRYWGRLKFDMVVLHDLGCRLTSVGADKQEVCSTTGR